MCQLHSSPFSFGDWAAEQLAEMADEFFRFVPANGADTKVLHQFRIQTKAVRYAIELLAPAFGPELRDETYPIVEELQERLGKIQDCVAGAANLRKWSRDTHDCGDVPGARPSWPGNTTPSSPN